MVEAVFVTDAVVAWLKLCVVDAVLVRLPLCVTVGDCVVLRVCVEDGLPLREAVWVKLLVIDWVCV